MYVETMAIQNTPSQGSPPQALTSAWRRRGQRSNLVGRVRCRCGCRVCGGDECAACPGHAKTPLQGGRKTVPGLSPGGTRADSGETSRCENEICLVAAYIQGLYNTVWVLGGGCCVRRDSSDLKYASTVLSLSIGMRPQERLIYLSYSWTLPEGTVQLVELVPQR